MSRSKFCRISKFLGFQNPDQKQLEQNTPDIIVVESKQVMLINVAFPEDN